jgi:vacuolar protein sorting-associated protein 53
VVLLILDIKSLDNTKKNLTLSINLLKRIHLVVNAMEQLKIFAPRKQYRETAELLEVLIN